MPTLSVFVSINTTGTGSGQAGRGAYARACGKVAGNERPSVMANKTLNTDTDKVVDEERKTMTPMLSKDARQDYREARHVRHGGQEVHCEHCDTEQRTDVSVDKWSGVACFTCRHCDKIQEC